MFREVIVSRGFFQIQTSATFSVFLLLPAVLVLPPVGRQEVMQLVQTQNSVILVRAGSTAAGVSLSSCNWWRGCTGLWASTSGSGSPHLWRDGGTDREVDVQRQVRTCFWYKISDEHLKLVWDEKLFGQFKWKGTSECDLRIKQMLVRQHCNYGWWLREWQIIWYFVAKPTSLFMSSSQTNTYTTRKNQLHDLVHDDREK